MGYQGIEADSSSVYYMPYNEYLVQSADYNTGQSTFWYKCRDAFITNPLDTYDDTMIRPELGTTVPTGNPITDNTSSYIMSATIDFGEQLIQ